MLMFDLRGNKKCKREATQSIFFLIGELERGDS